MQSHSFPGVLNREGRYYKNARSCSTIASNERRYCSQSLLIEATWNAAAEAIAIDGRFSSSKDGEDVYRLFPRVQRVGTTTQLALNTRL